MNSLIRRIDGSFCEKFGALEGRLIIRSPGRVNLIGEHTDYNEGFVLPAAIDKAIVIVIAARGDKKCHLVATDLNDEHESDLDALSKSSKRWPNYLMGVVDQFQKAGYTLSGLNCAFGGDIPIGAGMSSSAAIEAGLAFALNELFDLNVEKWDLVRLSLNAENEFVGVQCGIMDQFINIFGKDKTAIKLDCRSLEFEYFPFKREDLDIVLCDTQVRRMLGTSEYNVRRGQCETGVTILRHFDANIRSLRDVSLNELEDHRKEIDPVTYKRCHFVVSENERVIRACEDLQRVDYSSFGRRMFQSHQGLKDDYEVSTPELDLLVDIASTIEGVLGARMMGGGFGGCTINLVERHFVGEFKEKIRKTYNAQLGKDIKIYVSSITAGTTKVLEEKINV